MIQIIFLSGQATTIGNGKGTADGTFKTALFNYPTKIIIRNHIAYLLDGSAIRMMYL